MQFQTISVVGFALLGFSYRTLVLGNLVGTVIATVCLVGARPHGFVITRSIDSATFLHIYDHRTTRGCSAMPN